MEAIILTSEQFEKIERSINELKEGQTRVENRK